MFLIGAVHASILGLTKLSDQQSGQPKASAVDAHPSPSPSYLLVVSVSVASAKIPVNQLSGGAMGTWDIHPFDNDTAADFANDLDDADMLEREALIRRVLVRAADSKDYLEAPEAEEAVAAAALVAAQCSDTGPANIPYGPEEPIPTLSADLTSLAVEALDRVVADESELSELWEGSEGGRAWKRSIGQLRQVLDPAPQAQGDALFAI
ncbi:DUF4259 domain-containing protein [Streptomyces coelicoflavus]|uniref:DUF4259 domain-containing protein n=1 Tax=Streptomyces coelicoflavus TaxID=285562 RepID=UPI003804D141